MTTTAKTRQTATSRDGITADRTSARTYTHVVEHLFTAEDWAVKAGKFAAGWRVVSWHMTEANANKAAATFTHAAVRPVNA